MTDPKTDDYEEAEDAVSDLADRVGRRGARGVTNVARHPVRWVVIALVAFGVLGLAGTVCGLIGGYSHKEVQILSAQHVSQVYAKAYQEHRGLQATAASACQVAGEIKAVPVGGDAWLQLNSQLNAFQENYVRIKADYDADMANIFEAKQVRPRDLPMIAPSFQDDVAAVCPTETFPTGA